MTSDQQLLRTIAIAVTIGFGGTWLQKRLQRRWREKTLRSREDAYEASYDVSASKTALVGYVEQLRSALPRETYALPEVVELPRWLGGPAVMCRSAVMFAADRFGYAVPLCEVNVTPHLGAGVDGWASLMRADPDAEGSAVANNGISFSFREGLHVQPTRLAVVAAREVARVALPSRGLRLTSDANGEELLDAAAVLAGYGPLMQQQAYQQTAFTSSDGRGYVVGGRKTWLHRDAIRELCTMRKALSA